jgi:Glyoxalase/Bleomycin resistance protein/Dioxygenase superfamily
MKQPKNTIVQIAYVVANLQISMEHWLNGFGHGPFFVLEHVKAENSNYRGQTVSPDFSVALSFSGSVQIELIQQHDDTPSVYKELIDRQGEGYHHLWKHVDNFEQAVADFDSAGYPTVWTANNGGGRFAYVDTVKQLGGYTELLDMSPQLKEIWAEMEKQSENWDGRNPIRPFPAAETLL